MSGNLSICVASLLACLAFQRPAAPQQLQEDSAREVRAQQTSIGASASSTSRPNILWITAEDMSPTLGCYGDSYAATPHLDRFAEQSIRFTHAFATAPVCSPARSCLITGCYPPSLGTQHMRSAFPIPQAMTGFPARLRGRGYYTTNNEKTDYNTSNLQDIVQASWDACSNTAHWRNRPQADQPFFSVFNLMTSHQSRTMVWPYERFVAEVQSRLRDDQIHDPAAAPLPPYYPDTPVVRRTLARYYDCVTAMDQEVGEILGQLDEDGLADETIVFFYSDHGSGLPRHKRALLDSGMHVPLLIRFPEKYRHLAPAAPGDTVDALVSFIDLAPSILQLAGVPVAHHMQGRPLLATDQSPPRDYVYGHRDRVDEVIDLARSVRDGRYLYIRNYMPHLGYNQPTAWPDLGEVRHEFYRLADRPLMTDPQWHFAGPRRPVEELYDCQHDPLNLQNLAEDAKHAAVLARMRQVLQRHLRETKDWGFIPEPMAWQWIAGTTPWQAARDGNVDLGPACDAASAVGRADEATFLAYLHSARPEVRYWGAIGLAAQPQLPSAAGRAGLRAALGDRWPSVRIAAADALLRHEAGETAALPVLIAALDDDDLNVVLQAARTIQLQGAKAQAAVPAMRRLADRVERLFPSEPSATFVLTGRQDLAMFCSFATRAFLAAVTGPPQADAPQKDAPQKDAKSADAPQASRSAPAVGEPQDASWVELFDGQSLKGWTALADGSVSVEDRQLLLLARGTNLWLVHELQFDDFELVLQARMPDDAYNSGIGFRCAVLQGKPKGYQCEIAEDKSGMIYAIGSGWVWPKTDEQIERFHQRAGGAFRSSEWNRFRIRCEGDRIQIWVNDVLTADVRDGRFTQGRIALQHHGRGGVHRFRDIRLRPL